MGLKVERKLESNSSSLGGCCVEDCSLLRDF